MAKNYYLILGIASNASHEAIKAAFRQRALELHPDTSGMESGPFLEVQEAYGVLSDPERRCRYDEQARSSRTGGMGACRVSCEPQQLCAWFVSSTAACNYRCGGFGRNSGGHACRGLGVFGKGS